MDCAQEIAILKREVAPHAGGEERLVFNLLEGTMTIQSPPAGLAPDAVEEAVARSSMRPGLLRDQAGPPAEARRWERHSRTILTRSAASSPRADS